MTTHLTPPSVQPSPDRRFAFAAEPPDPTHVAGPALDRLLRAAGIVSVVFAGAIFGFFYAWVCSTMWGLDDADPRVAIEAMQAMNASVRNPVFFPAFFLTPVVLAGTAVAARRAGRSTAAVRFGLAAAVYLFGGLLLTATINVPMNRELGEVAVPATVEEARVIWDDYSSTWQIWNITRTVFSGISLALAASGLLALADRRR